MAHTVREKSKLLARVRRIRGQVEAIERALEAEVGCADERWRRKSAVAMCCRLSLRSGVL